ncbi:MAG: sulfite exporter TauE/SafE family protein [Polyangiaceae bacterium]|nr:sulfite exporter TauE/SafE family protein [Polyangiaceae bacterium]
MSALELGGALLMGLMGSVHCVAMCGPIAAVLCGGRGRAESAKGLVPHAGRLLTYGVIGALAGSLGGAVRRVLPLEVVQLGVRIAAAVLLIVVGFYAAGFLRRFAAIERLTAPLFARLVPRTGSLGRGTFLARLVHGMVWGLVPCGLVYGAAGLAALSGTAGRGFLVMAAFGAGTLPATVLVGIFAEGFRRRVRDPRIRQTAGLLLAVAGTVHIALAFHWAKGIFDVSPPAPASSQPAGGAPTAEQALPPPSCH